MSAPRISAVSALLPAPSTTQRQSSSSPVRPAPQVRWSGETVDSSVPSTGNVFSVDHEDLSVGLTPGSVHPDSLPEELSPGDVLLVKVVSTSPRLSLERLGQAMQTAPPVPTRALPASQTGAAMIPDQTAMLRMAWATPDAAALATSWRVLVLEHLKLIAAGRTPDPIHHEWLSPDAMHPQRGPVERWLFPIQAWSGMPMALHLLPPRSGGRQGKTRKRSQLWGVRVSGVLPGLGRIELQTQLSSEGASLLILAEYDQILQRLRDAIPALAKAVTRAGWRLRACQILSEMPAEDASPDIGEDGLPNLLVQPLSGAATTLPQALFRVAAEVLITLGTLGTGFTPTYR